MSEIITCDACRTAECPERNGPSYCDECGPLVDRFDEVVAGNLTNLARAAASAASAATAAAHAATYLGAVDSKVSAMLGPEEHAIAQVALEAQATVQWCQRRLDDVLGQAERASGATYLTTKG